MPKLTQTLVDEAQPLDNEYIQWDDTLPGYGLRVTADGVKSFVVQTVVHGTTRCYTIGHSHSGQDTEPEAREKARRLLRDLALGRLETSSTSASSRAFLRR